MKNLSKTRSTYFKYLSQFSLLLLFMLTISTANAQFFTEDFEDPLTLSYTTDDECSTSTSDYFTRTDGSNISATFTNADGFFFAAQDVNGSGCENGTDSRLLDFADIDISGRANIVFCFDIAEDDAGDGLEDWDLGDYVHVGYDIDATGTYTNLFWIEASGPSTFNTVPLIDTDFDGTGDGAEINDAFTQYCVCIPETGSSLNLQIEIQLHSGDEDIAIDNVSLCEGGVEFTNSDPTSAVNVFSVDATGFQTWLGVEIAAGGSWTGCANEGEMFLFRDAAQNAQVDEYTFGPVTCSVGSETVGPFILSCEPDQGGFQSYARTTGNNTADLKRSTMYNGPFNNQTFEDVIPLIVGTTGNRVYLADPNSGLISVYILTTGKWVTTYTYTSFVGGSGAGLVADANIIGVSGRTVHVLGADGTIDSYNVTTGALLMDNMATTFINGPLMGTALAGADFVGSKGKFTVNILEADGTLIEYSIGGRFREDFTATALTGGQFGGFSFSNASLRIVGTNQNNVLLVANCSAIPLRNIGNSDLTVTQPAANLAEVTFNAFPNPLQGHNILTVNVKNLDLPVQSTVTVMDVTGKTWNVKNMDALQNGNFEINMTNLPRGLYFLNIQHGTETKVIKIVK